MTRYSKIDLNSVPSEALEIIAETSNDYDLLRDIYGVAKVRKDNRILIGILKNERKITKEIVEDIANNSKDVYEFIDFDDSEQNTESYEESVYDLQLVDYIAKNPYTPTEILTDLVNEGIISALFNRNTPGNSIANYLTAKETAQWVAINPDIINQLMRQITRKVDDFTLRYLGSIPYVGNEEDINHIKEAVYKTLEVRKEFKSIPAFNKKM